MRPPTRSRLTSRPPGTGWPSRCDALADKVNVKARAQEKVDQTKQQARDKVDETKQQAQEKVDQAKAKGTELLDQAKPAPGRSSWPWSPYRCSFSSW